MQYVKLKLTSHVSIHSTYTELTRLFWGVLLILLNLEPFSDYSSNSYNKPISVCALLVKTLEIINAICFFLISLTFLLLQHIEWLQQLVFGTLHHAQPGLAFIFKCPEETNKLRAELLSSGHTSQSSNVLSCLYT